MNGTLKGLRMALLTRQFAPAISGVFILLLAATQLYAQAVPARLRGGAEQQAPPTPVASPQPAQPAVPQQPQAASGVAPSLLQQPAQEAQIVFAGDTLSIHANNSSLAAILRGFAAKSGMQVEGLGSDERVFGSFGPGTPRDVLADLLNGTAYNLVLLGDLSNGAPRELILTPTTRGGGAAPAATATELNPDEAVSSDQETADAPAPDVPPPTPPPPGAAPGNGVRTPQQLFEQLQRMRQGQQNSQPTQQDSPLTPPQ
jgi:hypothetical protein